MSDATARAANAQRLMDDPLLIEALATIETELIKRWKATKNEDVATREELFQAVRANDRLRATLQSMVDDGALVAARHAAAQIRAVS